MRPAPTRVPTGVGAASAPEVAQVAPRLWLVSATVPLSRYAPEEIQRHLQDLDWVSKIALAHEAVVERFSRIAGATVIPMKLFTLFSSPDRAVAEMRGRRQQLDSVARRIRGSDEWGVRIARNLARAGVRPVSDKRAGSGAAFLAAKKRARDDARAHAAAAAGAAEHALTTLARIAKQVRRSPAPAGAAAPPLLDAAFLVPSSRKARFRMAARREAERCHSAGASLTLTGPWPAYNFVQTEGGAS